MVLALAQDACAVDAGRPDGGDEASNAEVVCRWQKEHSPTVGPAAMFGGHMPVAGSASPLAGQPGSGMR